MGLFCKKYQVCVKCRVHFEPDGAVRHPELCPDDRQPVVELELRKELVAKWAARNWETLEPQAIEDEKKQRTVYNTISPLQMQMMAGAQNSAAGSALGSTLGSPLGGLGV